MRQPSVIAPSILAADFARLGNEVNAVIDAGGDWVHFDVMDNHFVPNLSIGPMVCSSLRKFGIKAPIDVHLMTQPVDRLITDFADAGASLISFHPEATPHIDRSLQAIKDLNCKSGLVFNPSSSLDSLDYVLDKVDLILIMSVNPGFGGQQFIPSALKKLKKVREIIDSSGLNIRLQVDGGINSNNIKQVFDAGADTFVAGSAIFKGTNYKEEINKLREGMLGRTEC